MTEEELAQYGMKRVGNTFTQTTGNPRIGSTQPRLPGPMPGSALGPSLRPNWVPGGGPGMPAPGSIPVGQATELGGVRMPAPGSIPVGQATEVGQHPGPDMKSVNDARAREAYARNNPVKSAVVAESRAARLGQTLRSAAGAVPVIAGTVANRLADSAFAPAPGTDGPGAPTGTAVDQIPGGADPLHPTPPPQDPSFFRDTEIGRNIGNAVSAIPGGRVAAGTLRAGSGLAKAADVAGAAVRSMQADNAMRQPEPLPTAFPPGWGQGGRAGSTPETLTDVQRGGAAADVSPNPLTSGGEPSPPVDTTQANLRAASIMDENNATIQRMGAYGPGNHNADGTGGVLGGGMAWNKHNEDYDRNQMMSAVDRAIRLGGRRGPEQAMAIKAAYEAGQGQDNRKSAENIAGMRETGDLSRAGLAAGVSRANNRDTVAATLRGQDTALLGHKMANDFEIGRLGVEQGNKDRQYKLDVQKFGSEQAKQLLEQRSAREGALQRNIEAANVGPDGKPDAAAAAEYRRGIDRSVARLGADGVHQLSPTDEQRLFAGSDLLKVMRANANWLPWNPDKLKTVDPLDLTNLRVLPNGDRQITRPGKAAGQVIPGRFFQTEEGTRFFGGTPTNKYDILSEGGK